jgi:hypothetical protein
MGVASQQGMITPPRHLIPPMRCRGSTFAHLDRRLLIPTCISRLIIVLYLSHVSIVRQSPALKEQRIHGNENLYVTQNHTKMFLFKTYLIISN